MRSRKQLIKVIKVVAILTWLIGASTGVVLRRNQPGEWTDTRAAMNWGASKSGFPRR